MGIAATVDLGTWIGIASAILAAAMLVLGWMALRATANSEERRSNSGEITRLREHGDRLAQVIHELEAKIAAMTEESDRLTRLNMQLLMERFASEERSKTKGRHAAE